MRRKEKRKTTLTRERERDSGPPPCSFPPLPLLPLPPHPNALPPPSNLPNPETPAPPIRNPAPISARSDVRALLLTERNGSGGDAGEPAGGASGGAAAAGAGRGGAGAGARRGGRAPARAADEGSSGGARYASGAGSTPRSGLLRRCRARRHGFYQRLPVRLRIQLPCCSSHFAVFVEPYTSFCRHLRTSGQAVFKERPSCMYIYYWRWDHRYTNPGRGMCISRNHCSHW